MNGVTTAQAASAASTTSVFPLDDFTLESSHGSQRLAELPLITGWVG